MRISDTDGMCTYINMIVPPARTNTAHFHYEQSVNTGDWQLKETGTQCPFYFAIYFSCLNPFLFTHSYSNIYNIRGLCRNPRVEFTIFYLGHKYMSDINNEPKKKKSLLEFDNLWWFNYVCHLGPHLHSFIAYQDGVSIEAFP